MRHQVKPGIVLCIGSREQRDRICRWLEANGANPRIIPEHARVIVTGNKLIVSELILDQRRSGGKNARRNKFGWPSLVTRQRTYRIRYDLKDIK